MPLRHDLKSLLVIGSGPIVIGQACEFDYSGTQACRVLRQEGIRAVVVDPNPAPIMSDPELADPTYVAPSPPEAPDETDQPARAPAAAATRRRARPGAGLAPRGGQPALTAAIALHDAGLLAKYDCPLIGARVDAIQPGEDRERFNGVAERCGAESARSIICNAQDAPAGATP